MSKKKLTAKQLLFAKGYLVSLNATEAALGAGYSKKTAARIGSENLHKPLIAEYIAKSVNKRAEKLEINADWVLAQAKKVHLRCMQDEPVTDSEGNEIGEYKFEHSGANKSLEIIGKHIDVQAFNEKSTVTIKDERTLSDAELSRIAAGGSAGTVESETSKKELH